MAMICNECGGVIPDVMLNGKRRCDCKNHSKPEIDLPLIPFSDEIKRDFRRRLKMCKDKPCAVERAIESERERLKGTPQEGGSIAVSIYCDCPKCRSYSC